jgi:hypothetical protein
LPVSPKILKAHGCDPKLWKELFTAPSDKKLPAIKKLETLIQGRIQDGQLKCILEYRTWAAVDLAYDVPFAQTTPTFVNSLINRRLNAEQILAELERWGLKEDELFLNGTVKGQPAKILNVPTFYRIFIPLVKAYVTIRWAKLFNDRNKNPLLKYEPVQPNAEHRILTEMLTYIVGVITADFGYSTVLRDAIFQTLMYSVCLAFPREVWKREKQTEENEAGDEVEVIQKEGIRYELPHPSRMFWDQSYPIQSFNTDTGCEFAGYWKVVKYGDILDNPVYWNRRSVGYMGNSWNNINPWAPNFLKEFFQCTMEWPAPPIAGEGTSRESLQAFYTTTQRDMAVTQTDIFMRLKPLKYKLGTYKHPIWIRFIVASDNTVLYAEPCCYSPILYSGYDSNALRGKNSSLALEVLPFQDEVGNILSQILLTVKNNLMNLNFYDETQIDNDDLDTLKNRGETLYRGPNFVPFNSLKSARAMTDPTKAVIPVKFEQKDVSPLFQSINMVLSILERLLQLSSQESGQAASHQQSKTEVEQIGASTDNRVAFTGSFIDEFIDAWKRQQYDAIMAYLSDPVEAMVPSDIPDIEDHLKTLGFDTTGQIQGEGRIRVKGPKKVIKLDAIAMANKGPDRKNDAQTAQVMMQAIMSIVKNPDLMKMMGPKGVMKMIEKAAVLAGADKDFKLRPDQQAELDAISKQAEAIQVAAAKHADDTIGKPAAQQIAKINAQIQTLDKAVENILVKLNLIPPPAPGQPTGDHSGDQSPPTQPQPTTPPPANAPPPGAAPAPPGPTAGA